MNTKETILIIFVIVLMGINYYLYTNLQVCSNTAKDLGVNLEECGGVIEKAQSGLKECIVNLVKCKDGIE